MTLCQDALETHLYCTRLIHGVVASGRMGPEKTAGLLVDRYLMREATPYAWSAEILRAVAGASLTIPDDTVLSRWSLETNAAWWYFQDPLPVKTLKNDDRGIRALSAGWVRKKLKTDPLKVYMIPSGSPTTMVDAALEGVRNVFAVGCWIDLSGSTIISGQTSPANTLSPTLIFEWYEGETLEQMHRRMCHEDGGRWSDSFRGTEVLPSSNACVFLAKLFLAGLTWMDQKILVESPGAVHRQRRKEFERVTGRKIPHVKVVTLRRAERTTSSATDKPEEPGREFSCRWVVDGHWRNARVGPGRQERRLVYVHPYVKGPEDKPLVSRVKVYAVRR